MKKVFYSFILVLVFASALFGVPQSNPKHEDFAQQYMPESQAVFNRLSTELAETLALQKSLQEDLGLMDTNVDSSRANFALARKITGLRAKITAWKKLLQDNYFKHLGGMKKSDQLAREDATLAKETIAWENSVLKNVLKKGLDCIYSGFLIKIPGKDYSIGEYEVTQAQYQAVMGKNPSKYKGENLPVECVSWNEAMAFCKKLTELERAAGRLPTGMKYTLPTSEQWEYACRAGTTTRFNTGDSEADLARAGWYSRNSGNKTHPVGEKEPNAYGLYDMHGNVWEWCLDERGSNRVFRGGSWHYDAGSCESSSVYSYVPAYRNFILGFRVALVPAED